MRAWNNISDSEKILGVLIQGCSILNTLRVIFLNGCDAVFLENGAECGSIPVVGGNVSLYNSTDGV